MSNALHHDAYSEIEGVNWSTLRYMRESPAAYMNALLYRQTDSPALMMGRVVHSMVLDRDTSSLAVWKGGIRRGKEWDAFKAENEGLTIITADEHEVASSIASAVLHHPIASELLSGGVTEHAVRWIDHGTGIACKGRIDCYSRGCLIDLKTTRSVDGRRFGAEAARFAYPQQMAHYEAGVRLGMQADVERVILIAVEKTAPYDVGVFEIDPIARQLAAEEVAQLLRRVAECRASGEWPGRYTEIQALQLPAWVYEDDEEDADGYGLVIGGQ